MNLSQQIGSLLSIRPLMEQHIKQGKRPGKHVLYTIPETTSKLNPEFNTTGFIFVKPIPCVRLTKSLV